MATAKEVEKAIIAAYSAREGWTVDEDEDPTYFDTLMTESDFSYDIERKPLETPLGVVAGVEDVGGGEGDGEIRYIVVSLTSPEGEVQFFRVDGYYASWDGSNWDSAELYEVDAVPVQKIEYHRKK